MSGATVHHIGVLVANLEEAIDRWRAATGYSFQPIARYRTDSWLDHSAEAPHESDVRLAFSIEGPPHIELMEFTGDGTHAESLGEGVHHLGFAQQEDVSARLSELSRLGIRADGQTLVDGRCILGFIDPRDFMGVRLEYVGREPQPVVSDDGVPLRIDERGLAVPVES